MMNNKDFIKEFIPEAYMPIFYAILAYAPRIVAIAGSRSGGKTTFASIFINLMLSLQPQGSIVITRKFKNQTKDGILNAINKWRDRLIDYVPELKEFHLNRQDMYLFRVHQNGVEQRIVFQGTDLDGVDKIKGMEMNNGYFSFYWQDEADQLKGIKTPEDVEQDWRDLLTIMGTLTRREGKFKDLTKYKPTTFLLTYNPSIYNSFMNEKWMSKFFSDTDENIAIMEEKGRMIKYLPKYMDGSGLLIAQTGIPALQNDPNPRFHIDESSYNMFKSLKTIDYDDYLTQFLGFIKKPIGGVYKSVLPLLNNKIGVNYVPNVISFDSGIKDNAVMCVRVREYKTDENNEFLSFNENGGVIDSVAIEGKTYQNDIQKGKHIESVAKTFVEYLYNTYFYTPENDNNLIVQLGIWRGIWKEQPLILIGGHRDEWLMTAIWDYISKHKPQMLDYVKLVPSKKLTTYWDNETRIKLLRYLAQERKEFLTQELTPDIYHYLQTLTYDMIGKHPTHQDWGDAYNIGLICDGLDRLSDTGKALFKHSNLEL